MSQLTKEQQNDLYRRKVALGEGQGEMTGYASIDKPWLKYYSEEAIKVKVPSCSVYQNIYERNKNYSQNIAIEYFGTKITYSTMFQEIDRTAEAFINAGIRKNDIVNFFTSSTPEIIIAILALGKIGAVANMINPTFTDEQIISRVNETEAHLMIVMEQLYSKIENVASKLCVEKYLSWLNGRIVFETEFLKKIRAEL